MKRAKRLCALCCVHPVEQRTIFFFIPFFLKKIKAVNKFVIMDEKILRYVKLIVFINFNFRGKIMVKIVNVTFDASQTLSRCLILNFMLVHFFHNLQNSVISIFTINVLL